jgi:hypothetical protein
VVGAGVAGPVGTLSDGSAFFGPRDQAPAPLRVLAVAPLLLPAPDGRPAARLMREFVAYPDGYGWSQWLDS